MDSSQQIVYREIKLSGMISCKNISNSVKNTKYTIFNFLFLFLYYQFKQPMNFFFLIISLSQTYPPLQVGFLFTYIAPLVFVMVVTMSKEAYDDYLRWKRDTEVNNEEYQRITSAGISKIVSSDIEIGQILQITHGERIPADMILLKTHEESGTVFIKTDQLDGETDWKLRKSIVMTQTIEVQDMGKFNAKILVKPPEKNIYEFTGKIINQDIEEGLSLENTLWANTTLASGSCIGIVIYTGKETRSVMNSREPSNKLGTTDKELNTLSVYLVTLMLFIAFFLLSLSGFTENSPISLVRYVLLLTNIIPISLRVNMDLAKIFYCYQISNDESIGKAKPRNRTIPEELGRIHYLLTDKTGTLTKNEMVLKIASLENYTFTVDQANITEMRDLIAKNLENNPFPIGDWQSRKRKKRDVDFAIRDFATALALCNNVTPINENGQKILQASSPDEIALVRFAEEIGVVLYKRTTKEITIRTDKGRDAYKILNIFPFTSSSKRMGIILHHKKTDRIIFYLKGADEVIKDKIGANVAQTKMVEDCETYAMEGLRTLAITQRILSAEEYKEFSTSHDRAAALMENRDFELRKVIDSIETNMDYLGVTGVEDKLQDDVDKVISKLINGGIKIWMLTGDKVETAKCIAIATGLRKRENKFIELTSLKTQNEIRESQLMKEDPDIGNYVLVIDGISLALVIKYFSKDFVQFASKCAGVVCCRVSPTQKSQIVEALQKETIFRVCAIGDGGNDVGMIQAAHVGIGVEGKEGHQASLAADFSISEFKYLADLVLWHGRLSYLRTAKLANFVFHRGMIISVIQILFIVLFYYSAIPIYNGYLMFGYSTAFTSLPVFALILDEDFDRKSIDGYPILYRTVQLGRALNMTRFFLWMFKSVYQGSAIMLLSIILFPHDNFVNIVAITFSSLIFTELLNIFSQIQNWKPPMVLAELFSLLIYLISIIFLKSYFDLKFIVRADFFWKVLIITAVSWLPLHMAKVIKEKIWPPKNRQIQNYNF
ncbi:hypothetical protein SteCoe_29926 [Stentor coeruleus]|uniref:Phospholipid-transporting ATPase n=1 Tax=Stentor coeruleus TaxID=5963 RepID=A0A1R2B4R6_9CILI|nr:hypothetical protein SteCoe_29926 [Stentor coeruleus]